MKQAIQFETKRIGVLGGGQLGRMMIQSAINYNLNISCLDPDLNAPCKHIVTEFSVGSLTDFDSVYTFGKEKDLITIEIENVNVDALKKLQSEGVKVFPQPEVIELIQDKGAQKLFYKNNNIPSPSFFLIDNKSEISQHAASFPFFQKLRKGGYDGRGVVNLKDSTALENAFDAPSVLESYIDFDKEISVIVARNEDGEIKCFPTVECAFNSEANLVEFLFSPANVSASVSNTAVSIAKDIAQKLGIVGLLAVEMFVTKEGDVLVNEIAPRAHNSGHHSIEGNNISQFEQHLRAILNLPLGNTDIIKPAVMINLLGEKGYVGPAKYLGVVEAVAQKGVHIHLYGKAITKPFRKMGHVTVIDDTIEDATKTAKKLLQTIKIIA